MSDQLKVCSKNMKKYAEGKQRAVEFRERMSFTHFNQAASVFCVFEKTQKTLINVCYVPVIIKQSLGLESLSISDIILSSAVEEIFRFCALTSNIKCVKIFHYIIS